MPTAIDGLKPEILWKCFYDLNQVPRPSKKEEKVLVFIKNFAEEHKLEYKEDNVGNIVIKVPATPGYEKAPVTVLQGHVDMVCEKNKGTEHDFDNDPIKMFVDGEWLTAEGTTLGADNGIGVAAGMAAAIDPECVHGPLELLMTIDEETGLTGANNLQPGFVEGRTLLNMDSEEDGAFYVGCAGGVDTVGYYKPSYFVYKEKLASVEVMVSGLKGGHSGLDVAAGRANAIKLLARFLKKAEDHEFLLAEISGGSKRNAIPREAEAILLTKEENIAALTKLADEFTKDALLEYNVNDGGLKVTVTKVEKEYDHSFSDTFKENILNTLLALPHGIIAMSPAIEGLVETSTNLATVNMEDGYLRIGTSQRSSIEPAKDMIAGMVKSVFELSKAEKIVLGDGYPGWQPNMDSPLLKFARKVYTDMYGEEAEIKAIHAGLECGILGDRYPGIDMISFGPTIEGAHSPDEKVHIPAVAKFWNLTKGILKAIAESK